MSQEKNIITENTEVVDNRIFKFKDIEIEFDMTNADTAELYERVFEEMSVKEKQLPKTGKLSEMIRAQYKWFIESFDALFGEGMGVKLCGEAPSVTNCYEVYDAFLAFIAKQGVNQAARIGSINSKYANRAQRRAQAKNKK